MKWMEPFLEDGQLAGKIVCPNKKCGAKLGNYDWAGVCCSCKEWVTPVRLCVLSPCNSFLQLDLIHFFCSAFVDDRDSASTARKSTRSCKTSPYTCVFVKQYVTPPGTRRWVHPSHPSSLFSTPAGFFFTSNLHHCSCCCFSFNLY